MATPTVSARGAASARLAVSAMPLEQANTAFLILDSIRLDGPIAFLHTGGVYGSLSDRCATWTGRTP